MVYHRSGQRPEPRRSYSSSKRPVNTFANDGSFLEMFKKMQEQQTSGQSGSSQDRSEPSGKEAAASSVSGPKEGTTVSDQQSTSSVTESKAASTSKPLFVGKRRGGRFLATGKVKKLKIEGNEEEEVPPKDAWSLYLAEVKKYKQTTCEEEGKTRPLVK